MSGITEHVANHAEEELKQNLEQKKLWQIMTVKIVTGLVQLRKVAMPRNAQVTKRGYQFPVISLVLNIFIL